MRNILFLSLILTFALTSPVLAKDSYKGKVVGVTDGDTVMVLHDMKPVKIRLANIDAPEKGQPFAKRAKQYLSEMIYQKEVVVTPVPGGRYGQNIASLKVDGRDVSQNMVGFGMAWVYEKYNKDPLLPALEERAMESRFGLWVDPNPVEPWEWRRKK